MTASEGSFLGVAIQSAAGAVETRDAQFKYLLFREGGVAPNNIAIPLGAEVGGGALERSVVKVGVNSGGALDIIPRPETLGMFLYGITGQVSSSKIYDDDAVLASHALDGSTVNTNLGQPSAATEITIVGTAGANGNITISGTVSGSPDTEVIALNGTTRVSGTKLFSAITSVELPTDGGESASVGWDTGAYQHVFTLPTDQFAAPYWTVRSAPGNLWGEQFLDARFNLLSLAWQAPGFVSGGVGIVGGLPSRIADMSAWNAENYVDGGPQFLTPVGDIELPLNTNISVLSGNFAASAAIPLDQQYVVGAYSPQGLDIVQRAYALTLAVKIADNSLYDRMMYDPAGGSNWLASMYKEGNFKLYFASDQDASTVKVSGGSGTPYSFQIAGNGQTGANGNVIWSAAPISMRAQRQMVMAVTGLFVASPTADAPITVTLVNRRASYAYVAP